MDHSKKLTRDPWHRHPLLVAGFSITLGSGFFGWLQYRVAEGKALREKRYAIAEEVVGYVARIDTNLRMVDSLGKAARHKHLTQDGFLKAQAEVQTIFDSNSELQNKIELDLSLYFSDERPLNAFEEIPKSYHEAFNVGVQSWSKSEDWSGQLQLHMNHITAHAQDFICSLRPDLPIKKIGAGKCD